MLRRSFFLKWYLLMVVLTLMLTLLWTQIRLPSAPMPQQFAMHFYRHVIGELDGRYCGSYPVCSSYAQQALSQHGWLVGSWLVMDRLIHEADDYYTGPKVMVKGQERLYDPLKRNDFWLRSEHNETE
ncbi:MAG: membrane protein insertion efficiency factor YidD [Zetaproteobacteria bacterium]|nr:membrane protein insertion efficiency factor YidD [Zetaproteobacteria bacterium]